MNDHGLLIDILTLLIAAVVLVPLFARLGLGSVLGYLVAGVILGPSLTGWITDVEEVHYFAEFGVMFLLFVIGIEMKPARLWAMRHSVFGLGAAQVAVTGTLLGLAVYLVTQSLAQAVVIGFSLALSSTAMGMQLLSERGELNTAYGRSSFAVLLFQDLSVVPLLGLVPLLVAGKEALQPDKLLWGLLEIVLMVVAVILVGRYLFPRLLRLVATSRIPEVFIAASLLVVLGSSVLVNMTGLSMALGSFLAGLLLSESHYRHQVMVDILPFRGLLLGLFFMGVGMSMDLHILGQNLLTVSLAVLLLMALKGGVLVGLARLFGHGRYNGISMAVLLSQGGEFSFVMFALASEKGLIPDPLFQQLVVIVAFSMALTPLLLLLLGRKGQAVAEKVPETVDSVEPMPVVIAGFGRVGQRLARVLSERGIPFKAVESNPERVEAARAQGLRVVYGDPARLDMLRSLGISGDALLVSTIDNPADAERLVQLARLEWPSLKIIARAHDRAASLKLLERGADRVVSETLEASLQLASDVLLATGMETAAVREVLGQFRERNYGDLMGRQG